MVAALVKRPVNLLVQRVPGWNFREATLVGRILPCRIPGSGKLVQKSLKVGSWIVDPSLNSMSSEGRTVRLEPKVMGVLLCLAQHPGETLSKEQLFQAVWPNVIVTDDVLKRCIAELRRAFDDDARNPHTIETSRNEAIGSSHR
jgi:DNA-binding response OmpR family regulator